MSGKIFLETSIFIRYFTQDDNQKYDNCLDLIKSIQQGEFLPYTSNIVITEIIFVLSRVYKFPKEKVIRVLSDVLNIRNITLLEETDTKEALQHFKKYNIKYTNCLIAAQVPTGVTLVTYDRDFKKIPSISAKTPKEALNKS